MLFPTTDFAIFFAAVFLGHWLLNPFRVPWKLFMIGASYLFYGWWDWGLLWLLALVTVVAQVGALAVNRAAAHRSKALVLGVAVGATLLPLLWFKYYGFLSLNARNALATVGLSSPLPLVELILPVGISFYTFMAISYVVDVHRGRLAPATWVDFFLYLSFFPHLVAGPIVRGGELLPQFRRPRDPRRVDVAGGIWQVLRGLFKKLVIASYLATAIVDPVFADPARYGALDVLFAIYGYAVVIYSDFSGYIDIAIGVVTLLGFRFPVNFDRPYAARTVQAFWRRWHITLSRWLRDYLYIPLGGSRRGARRAYVNLMITMLLGGLWHGAAWTFVLWGGLHGVGLAVGRWRRERRAADRHPDADGSWLRVWQSLATFHFVCLGWVLFRSDSVATAAGVLGRLVTGWTVEPVLITPLLVLVVIAAVAVQHIPGTPARRLQAAYSRLRPVVQGVGAAAVLAVITMLGPEGVAPFIYFQF